MSDNDIELRLRKLEDAVFGNGIVPNLNSKQIALSEVSRKPQLKNGQQKVTAIIGYHELIVQDGPINMTVIKADWTRAKFVGKCDPKLLERAITDGLVREVDDKSYDLTQKGEDFFSSLIKSESVNG